MIVILDNDTAIDIDLRVNKNIQLFNICIYKVNNKYNFCDVQSELPIT